MRYAKLCVLIHELMAFNDTKDDLLSSLSREVCDLENEEGKSFAVPGYSRDLLSSLREPKREALKSDPHRPIGDIVCHPTLATMIETRQRYGAMNGQNMSNLILRERLSFAQIVLTGGLAEPNLRVCRIARSTQY
jgi:hypothetical protein